MNARAMARRWATGAWRAPIVLLSAYVIALALLVVSGVIDFRNARELEASGTKVSQTIEAMEKLRQAGNTLFVAESSQRGYILTGNESLLATFREMQQRLPARLSEVGQLVSDTASQRESATQLRTLATRHFDGMNRALDALRTQGQAAAIALVGDGDAVGGMASIRDLIRAMLEEESRVLGERRVMATKAYADSIVRALASTGVVALALSAFYMLMQRYLRERDEAVAVAEASKAALERRVADRTADLANLSRHLLNVRENEKKAIARELHDDFGSYLTAINMDVSRARDKIAATNPEQAAKLERTLGLLGSAIELKRQLISDLRPSMLDNLGLGPAIEQYVDEWSHRTGIAATFDYSGVLDSGAEGCPIAIFRVFQEALGNVARHAKAGRVAAHAYRTGDTIEFEIADDGVGITDADRTKPGVHGLLGIRERVLAYEGQVEIVRGPQGGTIVRGKLPCTLAPSDTGTAVA